MKKIFLYLFLLAGLVTTAVQFTSSPILYVICKPAIMIMLGLHYIVNREAEQALSKPVLLAIIFSCIGDTLLMFVVYEEFFMYGLGAFLIAHVFYILAYRQHQSDDTTNALQGIQRIRYAFPIILSGTGLVVVLYSRLYAMKIPVLLYATVITLMVLTALFRFGRTTSKSFAMVFGGAILFMISDSIIAIDLFIGGVPYEGLWIMVTYIAAQYLIVTGLSKHKIQQSN